ncbi:MAG: mercury methylation ferredoxin HgcB [bacterium]|nr:mercury methylation ferredoxin HgcB [bacterium]
MEMKYLKNVTTLKLDAGRCTGCGMCLEVCPHAVFRMENRKSVIIDRDACMECGACGRNCPAGAISVRAGVGCAAAIIVGAMKGTEPSCGCDAECGDEKKVKCC